MCSKDQLPSGVPCSRKGSPLSPQQSLHLRLSYARGHGERVHLGSRPGLANTTGSSRCPGGSPLAQERRSLGTAQFNAGCVWSARCSLPGRCTLFSWEGCWCSVYTCNLIYSHTLGFRGASPRGLGGCTPPPLPPGAAEG